MNNQRQKIITCLGLSLFYPLVDLYRKLEETNFTGNSKIQKSMTESGYSCSIILQTAVIIESLTNRTRYLCKTRYRNNQKIKVLEFLRKYFKSEEELIDKVEEIFILRDSIAHNHLWTIGYNFDTDYSETKIYHRLISIYGDSKFNQNVCRKTRKTKKLKLNIVPIKISKKDVQIVFGVLKEFCDLLDNKKKTVVKNFSTEWKGSYISLVEFLDKNSHI
jgi:hypothetical protein